MKIKAITIFQPFATLIAVGAKGWETRTRTLGYSGLLAIHAGKRFMPDDYALCYKEPFRTVLIENGFATESITPAGNLIVNPILPLGQIIGICNLTQVVKITPKFIQDLDLQERKFGNFTPGRFALDLFLIKRLEPGIAVRGQQGLWDWEVPGDLWDEIEHYVPPGDPEPGDETL